MNTATKKVITPPCTYSLYEEFCSVIEDSPAAVIPLRLLGQRHADVPIVVLRHDIDHLGCVLSLPAMLEVEKRHGLTSSSYLIVDGSRYDPRTLARVVREYKGLGPEFGLHSDCYLYGDSLSRFQRELVYFEELYGQKAESFTQHGVGQVSIEERKRFNRSLPIEGNRPSFPPTDIGFPYTLRFSDAKQNETGKTLTHTPEAFAAALQQLQPGEAALFLTHPFRWCPYTHRLVTFNLFDFGLYNG